MRRAFSHPLPPVQAAAWRSLAARFGKISNPREDQPDPIFLPCLPSTESKPEKKHTAFAPARKTASRWARFFPRPLPAENSAAWRDFPAPSFPPRMISQPERVGSKAARSSAAGGPDPPAAQECPAQTSRSAPIHFPAPGISAGISPAPAPHRPDTPGSIGSPAESVAHPDAPESCRAIPPPLGRLDTRAPRRQNRKPLRAGHASPPSRARSKKVLRQSEHKSPDRSGGTWPSPPQSVNPPPDYPSASLLLVALRGSPSACVENLAARSNPRGSGRALPARWLSHEWSATAHRA